MSNHSGVAIIDEQIQSSERYIRELQEYQKRLQDLGPGRLTHIVEVADLSMSFHMVGNEPTRPRAAQLTKCQRFTAARAMQIAMTVRNGAGTVGVAVPVEQALAKHIKEHTDLVAFLRAQRPQLVAREEAARQEQQTKEQAQ